MLPARGRPTQPPLLWARRTFNFAAAAAGLEQSPRHPPAAPHARNCPYKRTARVPLRQWGATKAAAHLQDVPRPVGLSEEDTSGNASTSIAAGAGRVDDGDIRALSPEFLGYIPTGQIVPELDIGNDDIDLSLMHANAQPCIARFQNFIAGAA